LFFTTSKNLSFTAAACLELSFSISFTILYSYFCRPFPATLYALSANHVLLSFFTLLITSLSFFL
jgi:hypothetical protein